MFSALKFRIIEFLLKSFQIIIKYQTQREVVCVWKRMDFKETFSSCDVPGGFSPPRKLEEHSTN